MNEYRLDENVIEEFEKSLKEGNRAITKEVAAEWKEDLLSDGYAPITVNSKLSALNGLFCLSPSRKNGQKKQGKSGMNLSRK